VAIRRRQPDYPLNRWPATISVSFLLFLHTLPPMPDDSPSPARDEIESQSGDAAMGRAIRRTLAVLLGVGALVVGVFFLFEPGQTTHPGPESSPAPGVSVPRTAIPEVRFSDITTAAGITFVHTNGAYGDKLLPETMGGGVAFFDYDNDGDPDLLLVNGGQWPWKVARTDRPPTLALYRNGGRGQFEAVTGASGLTARGYGMGLAVGDYDNDGWVDVFLSAVGGNHLFHNEGQGRFQDVTAEAGVRSGPEDWSASATWFDADNDGDLDLFVCNYLRWSREIDFEANYQLPGLGRAYGQPWNFPSTFPFLYRNDGRGKFTDISAQSGVQVRNRATGQPLAKSLGVRPVDRDNDGWLDLVVANDTVQNLYFHNERDGTFKEMGAAVGLAFDNFGGTRGGMGIDAARFEEDNALGISIGNFANEMTAIYVARSDSPVFADEAIAQGVGQASRSSLTFGVFFFDYDLDGWLDLLTANGHIENDIEKVRPQQRYRQSAQLFWNARGLRPGAGFVSVSGDRSGPDLFRPIVGRGSAYADVDGDGDLDVVLTQINGPPLLLRNEQRLGHHWLRVRLIGTKGNRDAIGAWVQCRAAGRTLWRQVMPTRGYLSQSELPLTFGLGRRDRVDELVVTWPDGSTQRVANPRVDQLLTVTQER
jgi:hypothetical protein